MIERERPSSERVAIILAIGISVSLNIVTASLMYAAFSRVVAGGSIGLSENGTQLLTGWGGGIIGVLGSYIGMTFGRRKQNGDEPAPPDEHPPQPPIHP
jgi:uncharacterized membrane protein